MAIERYYISKPTAIITAFISLIVIAYSDYSTNVEISLASFYLIPLFLVALNFQTGVGVFTAIVCACTETGTHLLAVKYSYDSQILLRLWNMGINMVIYIVVVVLVSLVKSSYNKERDLARTDHLTGIGNWQAFSEIAERELERARRYKTTLSMVYIDCDNFKNINDTFGHQTGDMVLCKIAETLKKHIRSTDIFARLGGDEFAVLFTNTKKEGADTAMLIIQAHLINEMKDNNWDITFSIGIATFVTPPVSIEDMVKKADVLMYDIKNTGRNGIKHKVFL